VSGSGEATHAKGKAEDLVADLILRRTLAELGDGAGELDAEDRLGRLRGEVVLALALEEVHAVEAKGLGLARPQRRSDAERKYRTELESWDQDHADADAASRHRSTHLNLVSAQPTHCPP
jgi:hypothetical protein